MQQSLVGKTVAILVANGFDELDMTEPQRALLAAGARPQVVSPEPGLVNGWLGKAWGHYFPIDAALATALAADFDALLIPGGERSVEKLAGNPHTRRMIKGFLDGGKPVAAIGHAPVLLAAAERASGREVACTPAVQAELEAAGARVSEDPTMIDGTLITFAADVDPAEFKAAIAKHFSEVVNSLAAAA